MATIQVRVDDGTKAAADSLFSSLGLDTSTAVRIFLAASLENNGMPFPVRHRTVKSDLLEAIEDTRLRRNLHGPFKTAEEAINSMLED
ncbi:MAG: type II toxin-antitoxin system RelB/DinJ family antitoxin [Treponema sp.]|nr:type II toxin-antitoxin system RelB/DinJ family antitoxin [Treponema sp.]